MSAERKVLAQDMPQYEESLRVGSTARQRQIEAENLEIEKQNKAAEAQYLKEVEAYKKAQEKSEKEKIDAKYAERARTLKENMERDLANIPTTRTDYVNGQPLHTQRTNAEIRSDQQRIVNEYKKLEQNLAREQESVTLPISLYEQGFPSYVVDKISQQFRKGKIETTSQATLAAGNLYFGKQVQAERGAETAAQRAVNAPRYTKEQSTQIEVGSAGLLGSPTPEMKARGDKIRPTAIPEGTMFPFIPTFALDTRRPQTNVDTGQKLSGQKAIPARTVSMTMASGGFEIIPKNGINTAQPTGKTVLTEVIRIIPERPASKGVPTFANPLAKQKSLTRPVPVEGSYKKSEKKIEKSNIEILKTTLSRYQSVYGSEQRAPFASVLEASLIERGRTIGVKERLFIEKSAYKQYKTRAEAFGLVEAKGKQATYKFGEREFSAETGMGDVTIGRQLGFVFDYNLQRPTTDYPKTFEGSLSYVVSPKVQGPQKPKEETVIAVPGSLEYALGEQKKETSFNKLVETQYNKLGEMQEVVKKRGNILEQLAYAPSEIVRSGLGTVAMIVNVSEQYVDPFVQKSLGLKQTITPKPIELKSDVSGTVILPYQFEKNRFDYSSKEWASRQAQFIEKKGVPAYVLGVGFDYLGLAGTPSLIRGGLKAIPKLGSKLSAPVRKEAGKILEKKISFMLDSGKQKIFSYDIPYSPTKRPNEIDVSDFGERIGPSTSLTKKPVAAKQSDVIIPIPKKEKPVSLDPFYKPRGRREGGFEDIYSDKGEVIGPHSLLSQKPVAAKQSDVIIPIPKKEKPVSLDPFYKPAKRPNEIDLTRDDILATFTTTKVKLGKGISPPSKTKLKGKQTKPIEEDFFYKPAKRPNEIDYTDFADKIKMPKIEPEKSEVTLSLKRELERLKRKKPEFKQEKIEFKGQGTEIKSGSQILLTLQKHEKLTKKKLRTQRQSPVSIDWSEKIETSEIPKTGKAPLKTVLIPIKETKKKPYLKEKTDTIQSYDIQLSEQRPMIKTIPKTSFSFAQPQRTQEAIRYSQPQRLQTSQPQKMREKQRLKEVAKLTSIQVTKIRTRQVQKTSPKLASPLQPKAPTRLAQPQAPKIRQKITPMLRYRYPKEPPRKLKFAILPPDDRKIPESVKKKASEKADFLGNVSETQISGIFKRSETVYGQKKISRLLKGDVRVVEGKKRTVRVSKKKFDLMGFKKGKSKTSFW